MVSLFIILLGLAFVAYYHEVFLALIPGFYEFDKYKSELSKRNDLVDENNFLVSENVQLIEKLNNLGSSSSDFEQKKNISFDTSKNLKKTLANLNKLEQTNKTLLQLRLISKLKKYINILTSVDNLSLQARQNELTISNARVIYYGYRESEAEFNECIAGVNRSSTSYSSAVEKETATKIETCLTLLAKAQTEIDKLEQLIKKELPLTTNYIKNLNDFWLNSYNFHKYLGEENLTEAEKYNNQAAEYQRIISELDLESVNDEFNAVYLDDLINETIVLIESADKKQAEADDFFEKNLN